jgi:CRISPR-associated protein Cas5h
VIDAATLAGEQAVSFTVTGGWAHFRRVDANRTKLTYRLPPRTTVAGLCAAVLGRDRDSYYELFGEDVSAVGIGIDPAHPTRTVSLPTQSLKTAHNEGIRTVETEAGNVRLPDPSHPRQRYAYEMLIDPGYRIDVWLAEGEAHRALADRLSEGRSEYALSLGLSECLATVRPETVSEPMIEPVGERDEQGKKRTGKGEPGGESENGDTSAGADGDSHDHGRGRDTPTIAVDSAVPVPTAVVGQAETTITTERSPGWMRADGDSRVTEGWIDWQFDPAGSPISVRPTAEGGPSPVRLGDRTVVMT